MSITLVFALMALFYAAGAALSMTGPYPRAVWCVMSIGSSFIALFLIACLTATVVVDFSIVGVLLFMALSMALSSMSAFCAWSAARRASWIP